MTRIDYDERLHARYHEGRAHDESVMRLWQDTVRRCVGGRTGLTVLDLGSGTGRYSGLLADGLDAQVVGVEPSDRMRAVAEAESGHPRVTFVKGSAEAIPLGDGSVDVAWLSQVIHHVPDLQALVRELGRVVRPAGVVLVRSNFRGRLDGSPDSTTFSPRHSTSTSHYPTVEQLQAAFEGDGFRRTHFETVEQRVSGSLGEYADRIRLRTYSTFELMSADEFEEGMRQLDAAARSEANAEPVTANLDLDVCERR
jgi:ubiquinone/menaquinone biosynthesis C-methylase UbiE